MKSTNKSTNKKKCVPAPAVGWVACGKHWSARTCNRYSSAAGNVSRPGAGRLVRMADLYRHLHFSRSALRLRFLVGIRGIRGATRMDAGFALIPGHFCARYRGISARANIRSAIESPLNLRPLDRWLKTQAVSPFELRELGRPGFQVFSGSEDPASSRVLHGYK